MSFVRVVRFTDVDPEHIASCGSDIEGPMARRRASISTGVQFLHDEDQGTVVIQQFFDSQTTWRSRGGLGRHGPG